ncbi:MBL fold metallo-hydrolase [Neobacillus rhizophilus]|uniref:MBL fold metallo-hydrolase n=1 Tax=Neobacillus rhizophilus TaxID=2833579 RepID=A0A942UBR9_9BACI|nr:MBL fold metallo-hydrolase [Neobacillus rhizophilus]MBS4214434.1 MBL fold metallo-hydrolase [Neobacillus rhizophilus]
MNGEFYSKHFDLEKVGEGVYAAIAKEGGGAVGNAGFVDLGDQTIVFDTFNTPQAAEDLKRAAERETARPVTWVVNSHFHGDHIRGNQVFKESTIISSQITYEKMRDIHPARIEQQKRGISELTQYIQTLKEQLDRNHDHELANKISFLMEVEASLPSLELTLPQQRLNDFMVFIGTKRSAKLFTLGGGHSYCDAMLLIPEEKVLFMGDLLFVQTPPTYFEESNSQQWMEILEIVENLDFTIAVPGHGPVGTKNDVRSMKTMHGDGSRVSK